MKRFARILGTAILVLGAALIFSMHIWFLFQGGLRPGRARERREAVRYQMLSYTQGIHQEIEGDREHTYMEVLSHEKWPQTAEQP